MSRLQRCTAAQGSDLEIDEDIVVPDLFDDNESDNPFLAVEDAIDSYGRFGREPDGSTLCFEDFLVLKEIIYR